MKTPSPQEAAKTDWAEKLAFELTAQTCAYDYLSGEHRYHLRKKIAAALLDADKNGYERGRTSLAGVLEKHNEIGDAIKRDEALLRECWAALETLSERHGDCPDKRCGHNFVCDECVQVASTVDKLKSRLTQGKP